MYSNLIVVDGCMRQANVVAWLFLDEDVLQAPLIIQPWSKSWSLQYLRGTQVCRICWSHIIVFLREEYMIAI